MPKKKKRSHKKHHSKKSSKKKQLRPKRIGLTLGLIGSFYVLLLSICAALFGWGLPLIRIIGSLYRGYDVTPFGVMIGMLWAFIDGYIAGYLFVYIYELLGEKGF